MHKLWDVKVTLGKNFARLTFDPAKRTLVKCIRQVAKLNALQIFNRTAWWGFDPADLERVQDALQRAGFNVNNIIGSPK